MAKSFADTLADLTGIGKVVGYTERDPVRLTRKRLREISRRCRELRSLIEHAKAVGFSFNDEYSDTPEWELSQLEAELREHWHVGKIREPVYEHSAQMERIIDQTFKSSPFLAMVRAGEAIAVKPSPNVEAFGPGAEDRPLGS